MRILCRVGERKSNFNEFMINHECVDLWMYLSPKRSAYRKGKISFLTYQEIRMLAGLGLGLGLDDSFPIFFFPFTISCYAIRKEEKMHVSRAEQSSLAAASHHISLQMDATEKTQIHIKLVKRNAMQRAKIDTSSLVPRVEVPRDNIKTQNN